MTRVPVVDFRTLDRLLKKLGFTPVRQRGSHVSIDTPMAELQLFLTMLAGTSPGRCYARSSGRSS